MTLREAIEIFRDIQDADIPDATKLNAIGVILRRSKFYGISKADVLQAFIWLYRYTRGKYDEGK